MAWAVERDSHGTLPLLQAIVSPPPGTRADITQVWFDTHETPYFYWLIPEAEDRAAVGLIAEPGKNAREGLDRFLAAQKPHFLSLAARSFARHIVTAWRHG